MLLLKLLQISTIFKKKSRNHKQSQENRRKTAEKAGLGFSDGITSSRVTTPAASLSPQDVLDSF
jgi:hypothetical protein